MLQKRTRMAERAAGKRSWETKQRRELMPRATIPHHSHSGDPGTDPTGHSHAHTPEPKDRLGWVLNPR